MPVVSHHFLWVAMLSPSLLLFAPSARAGEIDPAAVDTLVREAMKAWHVPGVAVAVVRDGEVVYLKGHGVRAVGGKESVTPDTIFPIASCSKAFTTTAIAMLVDEGKMAWDDPVRKHVPFFHLSDPLADRDVTLRDLLCHRTGLGGHDLLWYRSPLSQKEIIRRAGLLPLDRPFRSAFQYQTTMFTTAGFAVRSAAKQPWAEFVQKRIFDPLEMAGASLTTVEAAKSSNRASGHRLNRLGQPETVPWYEMEVPDAAGSVNASARDLAKWVRFHLGDGTVGGKRLVSAKNLNETHRPQMVLRLEGLDRALHPDTEQMSYGLGWVVHDYRGRHVVAHAGAIDGFRVQLTLLPKEGLGIVVLANLHHTRMNLALSNALMDQLLGLPRKNWNAYLQEQLLKEDENAAERERQRQEHRQRGTKPSRGLAAYAGNYQHPAYGTVRVTLEKGNLVWTWNSFRAPLEHLQRDTFTLPLDVMGNPEVIFTLDEGTVVRMKVTGNLAAEFRRVNPTAP
jgi:CubicO group peptidase (beta-lactamase class C family)